LATALLLSAISTTLANAATSDTKLGVPGFMNLSTGKFTPKPTASPAAAPIGVSGTIVLKITAVVESSIGASVPIVCNASIYTSDASSFSNEVDVQQFAATRSGSTATCNISMPYLWTVSSTSDTVFISYSIGSQPDTQTNIISHQFTNLLSITLPKSGATTTIGQGPTI
jgi:hypothetical protein